MSEVIEFADRRGIKPATVLQNAASLSGTTWEKWVKGGDCGLKTAARIRDYIAENNGASI